MISYIIRRLLYMIPTLFLIAVISFIAIQAPPGDFLTTRLDVLKEQYGNISQNELISLRQRYGLDLPVHEQFLHWVQGILLRGDFGQSFVQNRPVADILAERMPLTIWITLLSLLFTWVMAIPIGVYSAIKQHSAFDYSFTFISFFGRSVPNFLLALILMYLFYVWLGWSMGGLFSSEYQAAPWSPAKLFDLLKHLILPTVVIGAAGTSSLVRVMRGMMLDEIGKQYVQTARAKGLPENRVIWKHAFKIAVLPLVSTVGWLLPQLVSGSIIVSIVLNLPTVGTSMFNALMDQDMYLSGSIVLITSVFTVIGTLLSDILLAALDPRIRLT
jgi:peptide/nickel transport system permease protein